MASRIVFVLLFINISSTYTAFSPNPNVCILKPNQPRNKTKSQELKDHLLCDYDKTVRPVVTKNTTQLTFIVIAEEVDFSDYGYYASLSTSIILMWVDEHLSWDPYEFDRIRKVQMTPDEIWTPDLSVYNRGRYGSKEVIQGNRPCNVHFNKKVLCILESKLTAMCIPNLKYWPYDDQTCTIKIGSWYHVGSEIDFSFVSINKNDMDLYDENNEWTLKNMTISVNPGVFKGLNDTFPTVKIEFIISRKLYNTFIAFILPYLVLIGLTLITLWIDPISSDRIYFSMLNIPCQIMFLCNICWELPDSSTIPYFVLGLRNSNILVCLILIETVVVRNFLSKVDPSPDWLTNTINKITTNPAGRLWLYFELNAKDTEEIAEDIGGAVLARKKPSEWYLLGRIIDKSLFVLTVLTYIITLLVFI